jgi:hypothetical protein
MKMRRRRLASICGLILAIQAMTGCQPVPTGPEPTSDVVRDRTFTSEDWGFSITVPPDSVWSLSASQRFDLREPNGLSPLQVILHRSNPGFSNRPAMLLNSFGRREGETLDVSAALSEAQFQLDFVSYNVQGEKTPGVVGGVESVEWAFRAREPLGGAHLQNNRFLSVVFQRGDQVYQIVCSGRQEDFPEEAFRSILGTFVFTRQ